jgi:uncharacterized protein YdbL (DUF1318 family)
MTLSRMLETLLVFAVIVFAGPAAAQANIEINTPGVAALQASMQKRHGELAPLYASGAVGLTRDGNVALRDPAVVPLAQRAAANGLVVAENQDRAALYREIARANNHPEWESDIRNTFAQRWIDRAQSGWYYQTAAGAWARK